MQIAPETLIVMALWAVLVLMVLLFVYQTLRKNRRAHVLTLALVFGIVGLTFWSYRSFLPHWVSSNTAPLANGIFYVLMYMMIYLHFEQVSRLQPHLVRLAFMSALVGAGLITSVALLVVSDAPDFLVTCNDFSHDAIRMSALLFGFFVSVRNWQLLHERESLVETIALLTLATGGIPTILGNYARLREIGGLSVYELGDLVTFIGLVLLIGLYLSNPNYLYRVPTPLYRIIIYNSIGIAVYSRAIRTRGLEGLVVPDQLMSMSITAVSSVLSEGLQVDAQLRLIDATRRVLLFEWKDDLSALLICERATYFARRSLQMLLKSIPRDLYERLRTDAVKIDDRLTSELDALVRASFPYVVFLEEEDKFSQLERQGRETEEVVEADDAE
ncbi:MAG: hypothetical protein ACP6IT_05715 [Candidatus Thorarchaeota archaeon]